MAEYIQNEDGSLTLVHETHQPYSEEWKKAQEGGCNGCNGSPSLNQIDANLETGSLENASDNA